jgi:hypothetical protein
MDQGPSLHVSPCDNNPGVCVKAADGAALTGRGANGRNPMALWGERGPLRIIIIIISAYAIPCSQCSHTFTVA